MTTCGCQPSRPPGAAPPKAAAPQTAKHAANEPAAAQQPNGGLADKQPVPQSQPTLGQAAQPDAKPQDTKPHTEPESKSAPGGAQRKPVDLGALLEEAVDQVLAQAQKQQVPDEAQCRWASGPIKIDGKADETAWQNAPWIDGFQIAWLKEPRPPRTATKARLLWDKEYLYFYAEMEDADLYADETAQDGGLWNNDVFELFFKPHDDKPGYYEFEVNAAGALLDMFLPRRGAGGYGRFKNTDEFGWKTAVALRGTLNHWQDQDEGWSVEGRFPWSDYGPTGGRPAAGDVWKYTLCRYDYSVAFEGPDLSATAPLSQPNFHHFEDYTPLRFVGPEASARSAPFGIPKRILWTKSRVVGSPEPPPPYRVTPAFTSLKIRQPLGVYPEPGTNKLLVIQHLGYWAGPGKILRVPDNPDAEQDQVEDLLSIDRIAYGLAFHPDYENNGYLFVGSNGPVTSKNKMTRVSRFTVDRQPPYHCDPKSEVVVLEWLSDGHNGGDLGFNPKDGMLYVTAGDGTSDSDKNLTGQDLTNLCATVMRLDVDHPDGDKPYAVPPDNPFVNLPGARPEIWAYGVRNPWRMTFDKKSGDLWVGTNGQDLWEQVFLIKKAGNYGWSVYEGSHPFYLERRRGPTPILPPILEHPHAEARSLTGGVVYYGSKLKELYGAYIYGDWSTGKIWGAKYDGSKITWHQELADTSLQIGGFGTDHAGELFVVDQGGGIYRLEPTPPQITEAEFPRKLSETGLFVDTARHKTDPGLIPYSVNAPVWADGAYQERWLGLPGDAQIDFPAGRGWNLPDGTVVIKTLSVERVAGKPDSRQRIETQMLTRQQGEWQAYSYRWSEDQSDAELVEANGAERILTIEDPAAEGGSRQQRWRFAGRSECMGCHSRAANYVLGLTEVQFNTRHDYGGVVDNQYRELEHLGVFRVNWLQHEQEIYNRLVGKLRRPLVWLCETLRLKEKDRPGAAPPAKPKHFAATFPDDLVLLLPAHLEYGRKKLLEWRQKFRGKLGQQRRFTTRLPRRPEQLNSLVNPYEPQDDLQARARAYLHANCAHCHVEAGGGNAQFVAEWNADRKRANLENVRPLHGTFGIADARLVVPGDPYHSVLYYRLSTLGGGRMPRIGSAEVDRAGLRLIHDWIAALPSDDGQPPTVQQASATSGPGGSEPASTEPGATEGDVLAALDKLRNDRKLPADARDKTIDTLLASTSGALRLVQAIEMKQLPKATRAAAIAKGSTHTEPQTRDLFERYLPLAQRAKRLGTQFDAQQLLATPGDPERGRHLWFNVATIQCKNCHRIGREGPEGVGPDLTEVGKKYNKAQLLDEVFNPSKKIDPKYATYLVQTSDGKVASGILVRRTEDEIVLKNEKNELVELAAGDVEQIAPSSKSLMPDLLLRDMSPQQAVDLLEFLQSLK